MEFVTEPLITQPLAMKEFEIFEEVLYKAGVVLWVIVKIGHSSLKRETATSGFRSSKEYSMYLFKELKFLAYPLYS